MKASSHQRAIVTSKQFWNEKELLVSSLDTPYSVVWEIVARESENADLYKVSRIIFAAVKRPDFGDEQILDLMALIFPSGEDYERKPKKPRPNFQLRFAESAGIPKVAVNYLLFREFNASAWRKDWLSLNGITLDRLLRRQDIYLESMVEIATVLLGEVTAGVGKEDSQVAALVIILGRSDCPQGVLEVACLSPNRIVREHAVANPNCPEAARVAAALLTPVK